MAKKPPNNKKQVEELDNASKAWKTMRDLMAEANKHGDKAIKNAKEIKKQNVDNVKYMAEQGQEASDFARKLGINLALSESKLEGATLPFRLFEVEGIPNSAQ